MKTQTKTTTRKTLFIFAVLTILLSSTFVVAQTSGGGEIAKALERTVCCEKTNSGLFCQDVPEDQCASDRRPPTSCESTAFCQQGWCYDSNEGTCFDNVAQIVCNENGGTWSAEKPLACNLGCCLLDNQASFVTQVMCKQLSAFYGLETNWKSDITDQTQCILTAGKDEKGACVYFVEAEGRNSCKLTTRGDCIPDKIYQTDATNTNAFPQRSRTENSGLGLIPASSTPTAPPQNSQPAANPANQEAGATGAAIGLASAQADSSQQAAQNLQAGQVQFFEGKLCSAEELGTNCGPTKQTVCVPGKEEVYFVDTCGNPANIYDASKINNDRYWADIIDKTEACRPGDNNADSQACGNCNYLLGSYCREAQDVRATYGDNICADLNCKEENGRERRHGESWCTYETTKPGAPGSKFYRQSCQNSEIVTEPCADFRQEECIENVVGGFSEAACRVNRWQDCTAQTEKDKCDNSDQRDCKWLDGVEYILFGSMLNGTSLDKNSLGAAQKAIKDAGGLSELPRGACVPKVAPGFNFWEEGDATAICSQANAVCPVKYEKGLVGGDWECVEHCECLPGGELEQKRVQLCTQLGDCGPKTNYVGQKGSGKGYTIEQQELDDGK